MKVTKANWSGCSIDVLGLDINCPLCRTLVKSGQHHSCVKQDAQPPKKKKAKNG